MKVKCDHRSRTHDLRDTGAMLYQLSYEATHWEQGQFILRAQNEDKFPTFSLGLEFLNETEKAEKNNGKGRLALAQSRFASLSEGEMQQILTERHW